MQTKLQWAAIALLTLAILTFGYGYHNSQNHVLLAEKKDATHTALKRITEMHAQTVMKTTELKLETTLQKTQISALQQKNTHISKTLKALEAHINRLERTEHATPQNTPVMPALNLKDSPEIQALTQSLAHTNQEIARLNQETVHLKKSQLLLTKRIAQLTQHSEEKRLPPEAKRTAIPYLLRQLKEHVAEDKPINSITTMLLPLLEEDAQRALQQALQRRVASCELLATQLETLYADYASTLPAPAALSRTQKLLGKMGTLTLKPSEQQHWLDMIDKAKDQAYQCNITRAQSLLQDAPEDVAPLLTAWHKAVTARLERNSNLAKISASISQQYTKSEE